MKLSTVFKAIAGGALVALCLAVGVHEATAALEVGKIAAVSIATSTPSEVMMTPAPVIVPWGNWVANGINAFQSTLVLLAEAAVAFLGAASPFLARTLINQFVTKQVIENAVAGAVARADGVLAGHETTLPIATGILLDAERYVIQAWPKVQKRLGDYLVPLLQAEIVKQGVAPAASIGPPLVQPKVKGEIPLPKVV